MNMHTEKQEVMLMTQEMVMFLLDLELKHFPERMLTQQHTASYTRQYVKSGPHLLMLVKDAFS